MGSQYPNQRRLEQEFTILGEVFLEERTVCAKVLRWEGVPSRIWRASTYEWVEDREGTHHSIHNRRETLFTQRKGFASQTREKAMAPHSSTLAWKIPWMEEPGRLPPVGLLRVGHDRATSLSHIWEGNGNPLQYSCLENPMDGGAWWAAVCGVAQSQTRLKRLSSQTRRNLRALSPPVIL